MALRAEIIAVGSELLTPLRSDTNALVLTARLREMRLAQEAKEGVTVIDKPRKTRRKAASPRSDSEA